MPGFARPLQERLVPRKGCEAPPKICAPRHYRRGPLRSPFAAQGRSYTNPRSLIQTSALGLANGWGGKSARDNWSDR